MNKILTIGGEDQIGIPIIKEFKNRGIEVSVFTKNKFDARIKLPGSFDLTEGNVSDPSDLEKAMEGITDVYVHLKNGLQFVWDMEKLHKYIQNILLTAKQHHVKRIIYLSNAQVNDRLQDSNHTLHAKWQAEKMIKESGLPYVIFKPSWFMEYVPLFFSGSELFHPDNDDLKFPWLTGYVHH